jgi:undecaprenyl-diphosphatase
VELVAAAFLGVVQGLSEFLPVSSSGHLILGRALLGWDLGRFGLPFDVACHVGTLIAVTAFFARDVRAMVVALPGGLMGRPGEYERLIRLIAIGCLPLVPVVLLFMDVIESVRSPAVVAVALAIGGVGLLLAERFGAMRRSEDSITAIEALVIGVAQASALIPGVSRSGATLTVAMLFGLRREAAARFVFLLSLPAVAAAAAKEGLELSDVGMEGVPVTLLLVGLVTSAIVGYLTIRFFLRYLANHSLAVFAYYRFALAAVTLLWLLSRGGGGA